MGVRKAQDPAEEPQSVFVVIESLDCHNGSTNKNQGLLQTQEMTQSTAAKLQCVLWSSSLSRHGKEKLFTTWQPASSKDLQKGDTAEIASNVRFPSEPLSLCILHFPIQYLEFYSFGKLNQSSQSRLQAISANSDTTRGKFY